jgi:hypothetical protein
MKIQVVLMKIQVVLMKIQVVLMKIQVVLMKIQVVLMKNSLTVFNEYSDYFLVSSQSACNLHRKKNWFCFQQFSFLDVHGPSLIRRSLLSIRLKSRTFLGL